MNRKIRIAMIAGSALTVIMILMLVRVVLNSYRAVMFDFEPWLGSDLLSHPNRTGIANIERVSFLSSSGIKLAGWYVPSRNLAAVVLTHGTNADRSSMLPEIRILANAGFGVLAFDWPGDGESEGTVHWNSTERDALSAAIQWLAAQDGVDAARLGGLGFSMGAYVMAQVASQDARIAAVVLEGCPTSFAEYTFWVHRKWQPVSRWAAELALRKSEMPLGELMPKEVIASLSPRPVLLVEGDTDTVVPEWMARRLHTAAREPKELWIIHNAGHGRYATAAPIEYSQRIVAFFSQHLL